MSRVLVIVGGIVLFVGLSSVLFELQVLQKAGLGWPCIISGGILLAIGYFLERGKTPGQKTVEYAVELRAAPKTQRVESPPRAPIMKPHEPSPLVSGSQGSGPKAVSFVAPAAPIDPAEISKPEVISKTITPEILNIRYAVYRCEISADHMRFIYQNAFQRELKWYEISSIVIRQMPFQPPWDGKLILDLLPNVAAKEKIQPVRILSSTFVNYSFLPQGQSASTKENIRRLAAHILTQNRSVFVDPGTDYFVHAGQPPVRFLSMSQFTEYDSRYS